MFTSETHGMAQRGGTVISHFKVGDFASPLIRPGQAHGLIALKAENLVQHGAYLKPGGWAVINAPAPISIEASAARCYLDADQVARDIDDPRSVNLIMLGFALSKARRGACGHDRLHCSLHDIEAVLENRLKGKTRRRQASLRALKAGTGSTPTG